MKQELAGSTSRIWKVFIADSTSSTGAGLATLTFGSTISVYYHSAATTAAVLVTLATMATLNTYTSGGFAPMDTTNMPGWYQFCPPNAALATGPYVGFHFKPAANMVPLTIECQLPAFDPYTAPATAPTNFSSLSIDASGRVDVIKVAGTTQTARDLGLSVLLSSGTGTGQVSLTSGTVTVGTNNDKTGYALTQTFPSNFSALAISAGGLASADMKAINGTTVNGNGGVTPWGP